MNVKIIVKSLTANEEIFLLAPVGSHCDDTFARVVNTQTAPDAVIAQS